MSAKDLPIVIAGGGIGGLATALALSKRGIASHVFERRAVFADEGAGIQIGPNGTKILERLGVADRLRSLVSTPDAISVRDGVSGRELTRLPLGTWITQRHGAPYWTLHRSDLHASLLAAAQQSSDITLTTDAEVLSFEQRGDNVEALLADAKRLPARALIAVDGLWSRLRQQVAPSQPLRAIGKCAYRGVAPRSAFPSSLAANDVHIWLSPGAHAVHYPVRGGSAFAVVVIVDDAARDKTWSAPAPVDWLASRTSWFPAPLKDLLQGVDKWRMWPLQSLDPLTTWTSGNVALLGDAAHPVLPFLAQGGVLALEDAAVLAASLAQHDLRTPDQLRAYAALRQSRAARVASASARNGRTYHLKGPMAVARNTVLRVTPPSRLMAGLDWLYGWEA